MALDGILFHKIIQELEPYIPARIQKIWDVSQNEILFQLHTSSGKKQLLISCHSVYNRMLLTERNYPTPPDPSHFVMVLRKYLEGSQIESVEQAGLDRWCTMHIVHRNIIGDLEPMSLYVELMGKYANIILVNQENKIVDALKRIPPFENNKRTIQVGAQFQPTPPQDKKDPFIDHTIDHEKSLTAQFQGFSPFLSKEVEYRLEHGQSFASIMEEIEQSKDLFIANSDNEAVFHTIELTSIGKCVSYPLYEGFDILYYHREEKERIKQISGDLYKLVKKHLKHQTVKYPRLLKEYDDAKDCDTYRKYGDLLYAHQIKDTKGQKEITLLDYETNEDIVVPLDQKLDGNRNAQKHYKKYNKLKKGQQYLQEQIEICEKEIDYFTGLLEQLDQADFESAQEIKEELISLGYMSETRKKKTQKQKKKKEPNLTQVTLDNGITISFGKNNIQNDFLTFNKANKQDLWFHAKDYHGAHVVVHQEEADEETIRLAANIAAYFSKGRESSSVPVNYCHVRQLKRIPGSKIGLVQLTNYQTIYIDPDKDILSEYKIDV